MTVAVLPEPQPWADNFRLDPREVEFIATRGSGAGGQSRNKTSSCIIAKHSSGLSVRVETERSQYQNKELALALLGAKLLQAQQQQAGVQRNSERLRQLGSGERGDKIRTYRTQDDRVTDHRTGHRSRLGDFMKGALPRW